MNLEFAHKVLENETSHKHELTDDAKLVVSEARGFIEADYIWRKRVEKLAEYCKHKFWCRFGLYEKGFSYPCECGLGDILSQYRSEVNVERKEA